MDIKGIKKEIITREVLKKAAPAIVVILRAVVGFLLARGIIFASYAPFGIAYAAASTPIGILGAILGYISILHKANGLKYTAICILIYTASYVFRGTEMCKKRWFMPLAAVISTATIGFVFVADANFSIKHVAFYITEICISALCSYFYQFSFKNGNDMLRRVGIALIIATLVIPTSTVAILDISVGRTVAALIIMLMGYFGGAGHSSAAGIALSIAVGAAGDGYYSAIYGLCGLISPVFRKKGKYVYVAAYLLMTAVSTLWMTMQIKPSIIYEAILAAIIFLPAVHFGSDKIEEFIITDDETRRDMSTRMFELISERIHNTAEAFRELGTMFGGQHKENPGNIASVFDAPVQKICKKCLLANSCWEREYISTRDALNCASKAMQERGSVEASDFPIHFSSRCIKIEEFVSETNNELAKFFYRKQCKARINNSRTLLKHQYNEVSKVFGNLSDELKLSFDERAEVKIAELCEKLEIRAVPTVYRDAANHVHIEIEGDAISELCCEEFRKSVSESLGFAVTTPSITTNEKIERVTMRQKEPLCVTLGAAVNKKQGTDISGDAGSYFRTEDGNLAVILADGMGSGRDAAYISTTAIKMLERFMRAGVSPSLALSMINSALVLKGEENGGFTTIDFMRLDLYTGKGEFYKLGGAPSYIKRGKNVRRLCGSTLPAGVPCPAPQEAERYFQNLHYGDFVIFATDGVADASDDAWLVDLISIYEDDSARSLAAEIIAGAAAKYGRADDMTVLVVRVDKTE